MSTFNRSELKGDDLLHDEKPTLRGLETQQDNALDVPSGYFPVTAEEKSFNIALNIKLDLFLPPFLSLLYLFNGLDRGNVGNAQTQGQLDACPA